MVGELRAEKIGAGFFLLLFLSLRIVCRSLTIDCVIQPLKNNGNIAGFCFNANDFKLLHRNLRIHFDFKAIMGMLCEIIKCQFRGIK